jgi:alpha-glucosidase
MGFFKRKNNNMSYEVASPNGRIVATFSLQDGQMSYTVKKDEKIIIRKSRIGFELKYDRPIVNNLIAVRTHERQSRDTWESTWGDEKLITDNYNELAVYLSEEDGAKRLVTVRFRAYDDGVAFRYEFPVQNQLKQMAIVDEVTEFAVDINSEAWWIPAYQPDRYEYNYTKTQLSLLTRPVHTPLTIQSTTGHFVSIHEAALYDYGSMTIKRIGDKLVSDITPLSDGIRAYTELPFNTPWRVIMIAHNAIDLLKSHILLNLNEPSKIKDTSWIKPTKFMGIWWALHLNEMTWGSGDRHGATTENAKHYIDQCKRLGIPALLIEGWNKGWDGEWINHGELFKFTEAYPDFDLKKVVKYAKDNGVELIAHHETSADVKNYELQLEDAMKFLQQYGIRYLKTGYVGSRMNKTEYHHSQYGVRHYQKVVELAAKYNLMLDVHEPIKGTGIERTWPNLMTMEGARGQEYEGGALSPSHACILPFTRLLTGGMDYTPGIFDLNNSVKRVASTLARQLAYYVVIYSSMQMVADRPQFYADQPAFKFIKDVPVDFEKTVPLLGSIGEYVAVARKDRNSSSWFVGGLTNEEARRINLYFDFIEEGVTYVAEVYHDGDGAHYRDNQFEVQIQELAVRKGDHLDLYLAPGGGFAIKLRAQ